MENLYHNTIVTLVEWAQALHTFFTQDWVLYSLLGLALYTIGQITLFYLDSTD